MIFKNKLFLPLLTISLILLIGSISYSNSFDVPFLFDDESSITENPGIRDLKNFFTSTGGGDIHPRRFVGYLSFALNYRIGGLETTGYHVVNLAIHLINALLVSGLLCLTFRTPRLAGSRLARRSGAVALFSGLLFATHPVQTQAVTYIVQRLTSLTTLFYLLSVVQYVQARLYLERRANEQEPITTELVGQKTEIRGQRVPAVLLMVGAVVSAILAMKTKEIAFTLPLAMLLYEASFFEGKWKRRLLYLMPLLVTAPIVPLSVLTEGDSSGALLSDVIEKMPPDTLLSRWDYMLTQFRVIVTYIRLLFLPINQNLDYEYPIFTSFFTPQVFISFLLLATLLLLAFFLIGFKYNIPGHGFTSTPGPQPSVGGIDPAAHLIGFGILWFFLALSVESSVIPITDVIFEHRLYLPSVGAAAAFAAAFVLIFDKYPGAHRTTLSFMVAALIILGLSVATFKRNTVWRDGITLWEDAVRKSPGKVRPYNNLGAALVDANRPIEAFPVLLRAIEIKPSHVDAWYNLGRAYILTDQNTKAVQMLREATRLKPDYYNAYVNLAAALIRGRRFQEAATLLEQHLDHLVQRADARFNLGVAYAYLGNLEGARGELEAVVRLDPRLAPHLSDLLRRPGVESSSRGNHKN